MAEVSPTAPDELAKTFGELKASGYQLLPVKAEVRRNLISRLRDKQPLFPGVMGYDDTVVPQLTNAILGLQDIILLGERGQAKSRIVRGLTGLLDEFTPVIEGTEIPESPYQPITAEGKAIMAEQGDSAPIRWLHRDDRYAEKLATPDITIADLIGEVDPIKIAEGRYLSDELTLHFGLVPRVNRGIFAINELPDLAERIQVGLLNLLEERDVQIRGFKIRLPLDVFIVATANPEDYTNRGRIITPLKDRYGAQIRTHYPLEVDQEVEIMDQEASSARSGRLPSERARLHERDRRRDHPPCAALPGHQPALRRLGAHLHLQLRGAGGQRLPPGSASRRGGGGAAHLRPRVPDPLPAGQDRVRGDGGRPGRQDHRAHHSGGRERRLRSPYYDVNDLEPIAMAFNEGLTVDTGEAAPATDYAAIAERIPSLNDIFPDRDSVSDTMRATVIEFVLEGLHLHKLLNKYDHAGTATYTG